MHGWRAGTRRADASRQVFWVFEQAGVDTILAEGGVGSIKEDLSLCHFIVPDDYIDLSMRKDVYLSDKYLLVMRDPVCPDLANILTGTSSKIFPDRDVSRGVYAVTDGRHFESRAEVRMIRTLGGDVIGQSLCPEVYLAREIGACYAGIYLIVNRAEGIGPDWSHTELKKIFYQEALNVGRIIIESLKKTNPKRKRVCQCLKLRKKTLLKSHDMNHIDHKQRDAKKVEQMFSDIAARYDLLNHLLSLGLDTGWRKRVARETGKIDCRRILDVCTGTGDMAIELCRYWKGSAHIEGLDFSRGADRDRQKKGQTVESG